MPVFEVYLNRGTGYVDKVVKRPREFTFEKITSVKDVQDLAKTIVKLAPEVPILIDYVGLNAAQDSLRLNPNITEEERRRYIAVLAEFRPSDAATLIEFDPAGAVETGTVTPAQYAPAVPNKPNTLIARYTDP